MKRSLNWAAVVPIVLALSVVCGRAAPGQAIGPGFELERSGRYADAAQVYLTTVRADPTNLPALLGLERVLFVLNRLPELLPLVQRARERSAENNSLRALELRVYAGLNESDSLEAAARRWAAAAPRSEQPYREWGLALADRRAFSDARAALLEGRKALGGEGTLAVELAELEQRTGNWDGAAREWGRAVTRTPDMVPNAASRLSETPTPARERVIRALTAPPPDGSARARRVAAELLVVWGQPAEGWAVFEPTLVGADAEAQTALRRFADIAGSLTTPAGHRVRGLALTRWADLVPSPLAERARAEAVRELLEGGDRAAARRVLEELATSAEAPPEAQAVAEAALLQVLIADGGEQLDLAERRIAESETLSGEDREDLRIALAQARIARGELDRAAAALGDDSSVAALAQRGWIALYRGDVQGAMAAFRAAGPYAGERAAATRRTAIMALLQRLPEAPNAELGSALLMLARGDSTAAIGALRRVAARIPVQSGRPDVLLVAGQVAARLGGEHDATAVALFDEIVRGGTAGPAGAAAAAAELEWARLLVRQGRNTDAIPHLERLILTYPNSAFVPEARRELERARGAIPRS